MKGLQVRKMLRASKCHIRVSLGSPQTAARFWREVQLISDSDRSSFEAKLHGEGKLLASHQCDVELSCRLEVHGNYQADYRKRIHACARRANVNIKSLELWGFKATEVPERCTKKFCIACGIGLNLRQNGQAVPMEIRL